MRGGSAGFETLRLDRVSRSFGAHAALVDLSLTVKRGEFIALLGPSGCGKSTALNCLAGLLMLTSGSIWLDERRIDVLRSEQRGFGMVFQNYALFPHMSVRRNIGFGLAMRRVPRAEIARRVDEALDLVQLRAHADKLPGQLSGGQQQRVAIARAIVVEPPLILMDEPLSNLDAKLRLEMRQEIRRIHDEVGRSTIYVTHDQDEALSLADRIVVLRDGRVRQIATPEEVYFSPASLDVALFMGFRNAIEVTLGPGEGRYRHAAAAGVSLTGLLCGAHGGERAVAAIRPDDLTPGPEQPEAIRAEVVATEFRGRDIAGIARSRGGIELHFRASQRVVHGEVVHLVAEPDRVLLFPAQEAGAA